MNELHYRMEGTKKISNMEETTMKITKSEQRENEV